MHGVLRRWAEWRAERHAVADYRRAWRSLVHLQRRRSIDSTGEV
jgi:hypothetical protein